MAAELKAKYPQAEILMVASRGGRFEVTLDSAPIFEKSKVGRHPEPGEIVTAIERARGSAAPGSLDTTMS